MKQPSRREFCAVAAFGVTAMSAGHRLIAQQPALQVTLTIDPTTQLAKVPADFMGLSYESGQLAYPDFFSAQNTALIEIFRSLSPSGVLRLGGNLSEFTVWSETEPANPPEAGGLVGPDPGHREPRTFTITPHSIRNLQAFLKATGWRCIYGLNLGGGTVEQALSEGSFVAKTLGPQLISVQFGNEPDLFKHHDQDNKPWTCDEFIAKWKTFRAAFRAKLPDVAVAGPDTASTHEWVKQFTEEVAKDVVMVTSHFYPEGPPTDPRMTIDRLLHPSTRFENWCHKPIEYAKQAGLPFRMTEGNSCYNAGKPGVSDTFAAALWAGDYCLQMASLGCVGVNLHGGAHGYYSPIVGSIGSGFSVQPEFYGLLLAQQFAGHILLQTRLEAKDANITAYAASVDGGKYLTVVFNKDARDVEVTLAAPEGGFKQASVERLKGPSIDSKGGVAFAGAEMNREGQFHPHVDAEPKAHDGKLSVSVPAYSAALIRLD